MNVGLFADCYWPTRSGVVTSILQLKAGLQARGHKVIVGVVAAPSVREQDRSVYLFSSLPFNKASRFRLAVVTPRVVARILAEEQLDLIHTHTEFGVGWAAKLAGLSSGTPLVHTGHTLYDAYRHYLPLGRHLPLALIHRYLRSFLSRYDLLICPSAKARSYYAPIVPDLEMSVVGNGVDADRFCPEIMDEEARGRARAGLGLSSRDRLVVYVGRLGAEKRVAPLLHALASLLQVHPNYKALFVGDGPDRATLMNAVRDRDLDAQVRFVTDVSWADMHRIYAAADLLVTLSLSEVHPMTLIEAAICGVPVVARRDVAYEGLVCDGYNGYLVDADGDLAARVAEILDEPARHKAFSANAVKVSARFSAEQHAARIEALYQCLLATVLQ